MSLVGRLEDLGLSDIFQILSVGRKTGTLIINGSQGSAAIVFKNGLVVRAESNINKNTIGDDLLHAGYIKDSTLKMVTDVKEKLPQKSLADILYEFGAVKRDLLERVSKKRIERLIYQILLWQDGEFQFELDDLDIDGKVDITDYGWEMSKGLSPEYLLMEGARVYDETTHGLFIPDEEFSAETAEDEWDKDWTGRQDRKDISSLKALTQELRFPNSTSEITLLILRFASDMFQRGVLFMVGDRDIRGLGQFGLDIEDADKKVRHILLPYSKSPFMLGIIREGRSYKGALGKDIVMEIMIKELGEDWPQEAAFFPLITDGKVVALLYCDNQPSGDELAEAEGLEIFISQAGLALEKAVLHRKLKELEMKEPL